MHFKWKYVLKKGRMPLQHGSIVNVPRSKFAHVDGNDKKKNNSTVLYIFHGYIHSFIQLLNPLNPGARDSTGVYPSCHCDTLDEYPVCLKWRQTTIHSHSHLWTT